MCGCDETSFMVTLTVDWRAIIATYRDPYCAVLNQSNTVSVNNGTYSGSSTPCYTASMCADTDGSDCSKTFSVDGLGGSLSVSSKEVAVYSDSSCTDVPAQLVIMDQLGCSSPGGLTCEKALIGENTVFRNQNRIDDVATFTKSTFDSKPYLIMEKYVKGTSRGTVEAAVVYKADGDCYNSIKGTSFRVVPNVGGAVTIATYPSASCIDTEAEYITVGAKYINTEACYEGKLRLYKSMTALSNPQQTLTSKLARTSCFLSGCGSQCLAECSPALSSHCQSGSARF